MISDQSVRQHIQSGGLIESESEMSPEYKQELIRILTVSGDTELVSAPAYWYAARSAPSTNALVSALAKLAVPEKGLFLRTAASSHLTYRLDRLVGPPQLATRTANLLLSMLFVALLSAGVFETVAHTACCFVLKR